MAFKYNERPHLLGSWIDDSATDKDFNHCIYQFRQVYDSDWESFHTAALKSMQGMPEDLIGFWAVSF